MIYQKITNKAPVQEYKLGKNKMNQFGKILEKAASQLNFNFNIEQSEKSEASYLTIVCYSNSNLNDVYSCLGVRLAFHDACTEKSLAYEIQLNCGFSFDYSSKVFSTTWGVDEDGDFSECCLDEDIYFTNEEDLINYMSECLVSELKNKI